MCIRDRPKRDLFSVLLTAFLLGQQYYLWENIPSTHSRDSVERLSEELKKDPFWVKRAQTEKMYTDFYVGDADASDPLCSPAFAKDEALAVFPDCLIISRCV